MKKAQSFLCTQIFYATTSEALSDLSLKLTVNAKVFFFQTVRSGKDSCVLLATHENSASLNHF